MSNADRFCIVDTAVGGEKFRNHPMPLSAFFKARHELQVDVYVTAFRYAEDLLAHWRSTTNERGNPTVAGYRGPSWAPALFFDLDCDGQPERSLDDARRLVTYLANAYDVPADAVRIVFSGNKGFHLELPGTLFGGFEPSEALPARFAVLATHLATQAGLTPAAAGGTFDAGIYNPLRLFRVENTRHSKTRLHAIPLSADELFSLDIDAIKRLAKTPRTVERLPDDEWLPREDLVTLWQRSAAAARTQEARDFARDAAGKVPNGSRHNFLIAQAARLERGGVSEAGRRAALLALNGAELAEPLDEGEVLQIAAHAHPAGERDEWGDSESITSLKHDLVAAQSQLDRLRDRVEAAESQAKARGKMLDAIAHYVADPDAGNELRLLIGLELAHFRRDPTLELIAGNRWRLTQKLARTLCGVRSLATAGTYARKLARDGRLPLGEPEIVRFIKRDGTKVENEVLTYLYDPPAAKPEGVSPEAVAEQNRPILLARARRLQAKREARGDARRFSGCPQHPHARTTMRRHCSVCDRCIEPRSTNVRATAPTPDPRQGLQSKSKVLSLQNLRRGARAQSPAAAGGCPKCRAPGTVADTLCPHCLAPYGTRYSAPACATGAAGGD